MLSPDPVKRYFSSSWTHGHFEGFSSSCLILRAMIHSYSLCAPAVWFVWPPDTGAAAGSASTGVDGALVEFDDTSVELEAEKVDCAASTGLDGALVEFDDTSVELEAERVNCAAGSASTGVDGALVEFDDTSVELEAGRTSCTALIAWEIPGADCSTEILSWQVTKTTERVNTTGKMTNFMVLWCLDNYSD